MGPRTGLDGRKISSPTGIRSPDRPAGSSVAIPTELPAYNLGIFWYIIYDANCYLESVPISKLLDFLCFSHFYKIKMLRIIYIHRVSKHQ